MASCFARLFCCRETELELEKWGAEMSVDSLFYLVFFVALFLAMR